MSASAILDYGVADPTEIEGLTGRQILQAIIDGALPAPRSPGP